MATTAIWNVKGYIGQVVSYAKNPEKTANPVFTEAELQGLRDLMDYAVQDYKTEKQFYVSGINCLPETARQEMMITKKQFAKEGGIVAFHAYQSFKPGEVTPELAHEIGVKLAKKLWGEKFQVLVATHLDKAHIHNHYVLNSVSFIDGKRYNDCKESYRRMRAESDRLCRVYSLSVIENHEHGRSAPYAAWQAEKQGKSTWWSIVRSDTDMAIRQSMTMSAFMRNLKSQGYEIKTGKYLAVRPEGKERFVRLKTLGDNYTEEAITRRILAQRVPEYPQHVMPIVKKKARVYGDFKLSKVTFKSIQALYFHYVYLLKKAQRQPTQNVSFILKDELRKMNEYSLQAIFLSKNKIQTRDELNDFMLSKEKQLKELTDQRTKVSNMRRRMSDPSKAADLKQHQTELTKEISALRSELKLAVKVISYCDEIRDRLESVNEYGEGQKRRLEKEKEVRQR